jgi:hypothetical protein
MEVLQLPRSFRCPWPSITRTKSSLHILPHNYLFPLTVLLITSRHGPRRNTVHCCTSIISVGIYLPAKALLSTVAFSCLLKICLLAADVVSLFVSRSLPSNGSKRYNIYIYIVSQEFGTILEERTEGSL